MASPNPQHKNVVFPSRIPFEDDDFKWDYDDKGVICRFNKEEESWEVMEPYCVECGHRDDDECECVNFYGKEEEEEEEMGLCEYTCRAETSGDIARVREAWVKGGVKIEGETITPETIMGVPIPDCEWNVAVSSAHTLDDLVRIAKTVPDSHVIAETLKRKEDYTGERA